jgi:hypothetical protein
MMKRYFSGGTQGKGDPSKRPEEDKGNGKEKDDDFLNVNNCFMILGGAAAYDSGASASWSAKRSTPPSQPRQPSSTGLGLPSHLTATTTRITSHSRADTRLLSTLSSATRGSPKY